MTHTTKVVVGNNLVVCENGHVINVKNEQIMFCGCGAKAVRSCPSCSAGIYGTKYRNRETDLKTAIPFYHCPVCGKAYPWTERLFDSIERCLSDDDVPAELSKEIRDLFCVLATDSDLHDIHVSRFKQIIGQLKQRSFEVIKQAAVKVLSEAICSQLF